MLARMLLRLVGIAALLAACAHDGPDSPWFDEPLDPPTDPPAQPPSDPPSNPPVTVHSLTLQGMQPGWRVTTTRLTNADPVREETVVADGSPIVLEGTEHDVFVAIVTDSAGALVEVHAMKSACSLAEKRRLDVPGEYATIQAAVDAANPGDTVRVAPGEYTESIQMREGVCLLGSGAKRTILDAHGAGRRLVDLSNAPGSIVAGFTIRGTAPKVGCANQDPFTCSGNWYTAGVFLSAPIAFGEENATKRAPPMILNNIFEANYIGVMLNFHGIGIVRNNVFVRNRNGLVANHYQDRTLVANNVFIDNTELAIGNQAAYLDLIDNVIAGSPVGVRFAYIQTGDIRCNVFHANGAHQSSDYVGPARFTIGTNGNVEAAPRLVGNGDYHLAADSPGKGTGCHGERTLDPSGALPDRGAYGGPLAAWVDL